MKCTRAFANSPGCQQRRHANCRFLHGVDFVVVLTESVRGLEVLTGLAYSAISALLLSSFKFWEWAVNTDKEHVEWRQEIGKAILPLLCFQDVLDDQAVPTLGQARDTSVKSLEERRSQSSPRKLPGVDAFSGQDASAQKVIDGVVPKRIIKACLQGTRQCGLARAGRPIEQDDFPGRLGHVLKCCVPVWAANVDGGCGASRF